MLIAEMLLLTALNDKGHVPVGSGALIDAGLTGALLADLAIDGRLAVAEDGTVRAAGTRPGDELLADAWDAVREHLRGRNVRHVIGGLSHHIGGSRDRVAGRLTGAGVLGRDRPSPLRPTRHLVLDTAVRQGVLDQIRAAAAGEGPVPPRVAVVLALIGPCRLLERVAPDPGTRGEAKRRIDRVTSETPLAPGAATIVDELIVATTVTATTVPPSFGFLAAGLDVLASGPGGSPACRLPPGSGTRSAGQPHAINQATIGGHPLIMADVQEVEVVVAHNERATLRVGDVFLKIDADQTRIDVEVEAMAMAPVPTPEVLWRKQPVLALAAVRGTALGRLGEPSTASPAAWAAAGAATRRLHDAPLPPWPGRRLDELASHLDGECEWLLTNGVLPADLVTRNRRVAEAALRPWTPVFIHGDLQVDHVFVDGDEVTGVVDWSEASQGDALFDLAILTLGHEEHLGDVVAGYGTDVDRDLIRAWWSLRCLTNVRWLSEHGFDPSSPGCEVDVLRSRL